MSEENLLLKSSNIPTKSERWHDDYTPRISFAGSHYASGSVQLENTGLTRQTLDRYQVTDELFEKRVIFKESVAAKLREVCSEAAQKLSDCHSRQIVQVCQGCNSHRKFWNRCDLFYCPVCQPKLAWERRKSIEWWTKLIRQPKHVVLTTKNTPTLTRDQVRDIKDAFTRLRNRKFARNWQGGLYSLEVTNEGKGWHLHIHALIEARYIDCKELAIEWAKCTKDSSYIVKVKDARDKTYLAEVTKYAVKGSELSKWEPAEIAQYILAFQGMRQFGVFGSLFKQRAEWNKAKGEIFTDCKCAKCQSTEFKYFSLDEWEASYCKGLSPPAHKALQVEQFEMNLTLPVRYM